MSSALGKPHTDHERSREANAPASTIHAPR